MSETDRLTTWALAHTTSSDYSEAFWSQVMFVRDKVSGLFARTYEEYRDLVDVVSTHCSRSVTCPVYFIDLPKDGVRIWMRYNFYNWNVSVESERPITCDFLDTFEDDGTYCFCEGMTDKKFGTHKENNKKFTVCIDTDYELYTFFKTFRKFFGIKKETNAA